ncbi:MAG TPA: hypothetical protein VMU69_04530 [Bradyrhizobium sp.]|nr:hypothetical protein [Bradyrhizobium sp.]
MAFAHLDWRAENVAAMRVYLAGDGGSFNRREAYDHFMMVVRTGDLAQIEGLRTETVLLDHAVCCPIASALWAAGMCRVRWEHNGRSVEFPLNRWLKE